MLARENRLTAAADFKAAIKTGRKQTTSNLVIYLKRVEVSTSARFGFLVSKLVGNAVKRNLVKRRLREIMRTKLSSFDSSLVVVRALPGAAELSFSELSEQVETALVKLVSK
ncbi:MAG: ribonuclease P protein component [Micrococcales bacterium]